MNLPDKFKTKMKELLGDEYDDYIKSYELPKYQGIRVNTLKVSLDEWKEINPFKSLEEVPWCKEGYYYDSSEETTKHPYYYAGLYYIQEPSAMSPGAYLPVTPGDKILDLCAAPGGKSTQLAARMEGRGVLVANDISVSRAKALLKNLENFGVRNAIVTSEDSTKLSSKWKGYFDKILIDAPCSGEGMFRKNETAIKSWETHGIDYCMPLQETILEDAATMLKPDGMILYSTCTFSPEENEMMISQFIDSNPDFSVVNLTPVGGIKNARSEWAEGNNGVEGGLRLWPHHLKGEGHFVCLLKRNGDNTSEKTKYQKYKSLKDYAVAKDFIKDNMNIDEDLNIMEVNGKLYSIPDETPLLEGIRVVRSGLLLGELKNKRFEPSHALTLAYDQTAFKKVINLDSSSDEIKRYLKGETIIYKADKGYNLMSVDGYPIGWVKAQDDKLKNQYPTSWRMI